MIPKNLVGALGVLCLLLPFTATTQAAVTPLRCFHFGDADPGIVPGGIAITSKDSASTNPLTTIGSPIYTSEGANEFSDRAILFNGSTQWAATPGPDTLTTNFGVEAWVKPTGAVGKQVIIYCGTPGADGWGLIQQTNGQFAAEFGGQVTFGQGAVVPGTWTHVAFVVTNGTATFYVNGVQAGPSVEATPIATGPGAELCIAAAPTTPLSDFFGGQIDKLRVFTFATGAFVVEDLLYTPPLNLALAVDGTNATGSFSLKHWLHQAEATTDLLTIPWTPVSGVSNVGQNYSFTEALARQKFYRLNLRNQNPQLPPGKYIIINTVNATKNVTNLLAANANRIVGSQPSSIDASAFVDPANVDGGAEAMDFHWVVSYPQLDDPYSAKGMTGYYKPVLSAVPDSYAQQPDPPAQNGPGVQFLLTISSKRTGRSTIVDLRAQIVQGGLDLTMYNNCQVEDHACGACPCTIEAALPEDNFEYP